MVTIVIIAITTICTICSWYGVGQPYINNLSPVSWDIVANGAWWALFTNMLLHSSLMHLANNMASLGYLGRFCEQAYGKFWYIVLYILGGVFAALTFCYVRHALGDNSVAVGASGAIFACFGAYGSWLFRLRDTYGKNNPELNVAIANFGKVLLWNICYGLFFSVAIANECHIGGFIFGFAFDRLYSLLKPMKERKR